MKLAPVPQTLMEWIALKADMVPVPLAHTHICFMLSKAILEAFEKNVFETFKDGSKTAGKAAVDLKLDERALKSLLNVLIATGYLRFKNDLYSLTKHSRKWCLIDSPNSLYNQQLFNNVCWKWMEYFPEFLKTGKGLQYHETFNEKEWGLYQKGMESVATNTTKFAVRMAPKIRKAEKMLDIGGSHGLYCVEFCKKYPSMQAIILDLPPAVEKAEPILRKRYDGKNINYKRGNALTDNFGKDEYDLVLMSSLMHHFTAEQNKSVSKKIGLALKTGGYFIIQEFIRPEPSSRMEMVGTILDLFFNLSSTSGNWSTEELIGFQNEAGLQFLKINKFFTTPGFVQVVGQKI